MKTFFVAAENENSPSLLRYSLCNLPSYSAPLQFNQTHTKKKKKSNIAFPICVNWHCGGFIKEVFYFSYHWQLSIISCPTTFRQPKRLKKLAKFENQKVLSFSVPQDGFLSRSSSRESRQKKLIWLSRAKSCLFFFPRLLALSLARSLPAWQPSRAILAELQPVPGCRSSCFQKMLFANQLIDLKTGNCGSVTKSWHQHALLLPNRLIDFMVSYLLQGI